MTNSRGAEFELGDVFNLTDLADLNLKMKLNFIGECKHAN